MTHYVHTTAIAFMLGRWREDPSRRSYQMESLAREERVEDKSEPKPSIFKRGFALFRSGKVADKSRDV